jgi:hypothetical protein
LAQAWAEVGRSSKKAALTADITWKEAENRQALLAREVVVQSIRCRDFLNMFFPLICTAWRVACQPFSCSQSRQPPPRGRRSSTFILSAAGYAPTFNLVSRESIEGTNVYDPRGNKIGQIDHLMTGGFMGLGHSHYRLVWNAIRYDSARQDAPQFKVDRSRL